MAERLYRVIMVVGDNHSEIIKKYSADTKVGKHVFLKRDDINKHKDARLMIIKGILDNQDLSLNETQRKIYEDMYDEIKEMDDIEYFYDVTEGCTYDEKTGDAYTNKNLNAHYRWERCPQYSFIQTGEESVFASPFVLKDGTYSYSAKMGDIDWNAMHLHNLSPYESAWEMVVEGRKPTNDSEKQIYDAMKTKISYFTDNFQNKDEYVSYSCSFWCYGIATEDKYIDVDEVKSIKDWIKNFYQDYIKPLDKDQLLTIYEVRSL